MLEKTSGSLFICYATVLTGQIGISCYQCSTVSIVVKTLHKTLGS